MALDLNSIGVRLVNSLNWLLKALLELNPTWYSTSRMVRLLCFSSASIFILSLMRYSRIKLLKFFLYVSLMICESILGFTEISLASDSRVMSGFRKGF